jgi:hypothetical protein
MHALSAAYQLVLYSDGDPTDTVALSPLITWAVFVGAGYGLLRLLISPIMLAVRWEERRKAARGMPPT